MLVYALGEVYRVYCIIGWAVMRGCINSGSLNPGGFKKAGISFLEINFLRKKPGINIRENLLHQFLHPIGITYEVSKYG